MSDPASIKSSDSKIPILIAIVIFSLLSIIAAIFSRGLLLADGYMHYLYARFAFTQPMGVVDFWGRPACTIYYAIAALYAGRIGVCLASLVLALLCAMLAREI